ncbi:Uncharacterized protein APZ42_021829 [Daphnia magna]|uniref:Uncharacterized protein n=1 Tax=Daphnia magna TaxID=35525 RepID=A0A164WA39_9CRUS|nr:Uncharacterized protein APZ42_021829 [Daphnia magna]
MVPKDERKTGRHCSTQTQRHDHCRFASFKSFSSFLCVCVCVSLSRRLCDDQNQERRRRTTALSLRDCFLSSLVLARDRLRSISTCGQF